MGYTTLTLSIEDHVATVTLSRPEKLNTMNIAFWNEMREAFAEIDRSTEARAAVLASTGKHFTAGLDLNEFAGAFAPGAGDEARRREHLRRLVLLMQESFNVIERCRVPVLAAVHGACIGRGVDMISATDARYCTADAYFVIKEIDLGMTADVGTLQRLPHLIPAGWAREMAYTGRRLPAAKAKEIGLVNEVYPDRAAMLAAVTETAREIASKSPMAIQGTKEMLNYTRDHSVADALGYVATWQAGMLMGDDLMAAIAAGMTKQKAEFADVLPPPEQVEKQ
ncbi:MAG: crotonase/enoyl-CoA hydratase family protein [Candidatus Methylomirabilis sp.]|nr:crotonase/enoyl-CoA hydratase family protein [Deltaproteobacteria bacterium]